MINETEREKLKKTIGFPWISKINKFFTDQKIQNRYDRPYTSRYISKVFNGDVENEAVESGIYDFAAKRKAESKKQTARKKEILKA